MSLTLSPALAAILATSTPIDFGTPQPMTQQEVTAAARSRATRANRQHKKAAHEAVLASVDGDRESLKTITVWVPRKRTERLFARAFDRKSLAEGGAAFQDAEYEFEATEYDLEEIEVERARHPDEEVAFARLQKRFRESKPSIQGFFHKPTTKHGDRRQRRVLPAPLGDFNWVERNEDVSREQQLAQSLAKLRAARPIRNVRESAQ